MRLRGRLFWKYAVLIVTLVGAALIANGALSIYSTYLEIRAGLLELSREKAGSASTRIEQFIKEIERQLGWMTLPSVSAGLDFTEVRKLDIYKLLRQVPAISEVSEIDVKGRELIKISRVKMDVIGSGKDRSTDPAFLSARTGETYYGQIYFYQETEPYMSIGVRSHSGSVIIAEVNLKFIWEVISRIRVGRSGFAYVIDSGGKLIAHPDISLVLRQVEMGHLVQVRAAMAILDDEERGSFDDGYDLNGESVLSAFSHERTLGWTVFVEQPKSEAFAPLYTSLFRNTVVLVGALLLAMLASMFLARRMVAPVSALREAAEDVGAGHLDRRIDISTDDEVQELAEQFNNMASKLSESYENLENKVVQRTAELASEQEKTRSLLLNILPEAVIDELSETGEVKTVRHEKVTIMFADFVDFTQATSTMPADHMVSELNAIFSVFDEIIYEEKVEKIKTIGDSYMAAAGLTGDTVDHAHRCVRAALRILDYLAERNRDAAFKWQLRVGIHSGPVVSGVVGKKKYAFDIWGDAVNIASRLESSGEVGKVNISAYTFDLIGDAFDCSYRGKVSAKGKGEIDMYFVRKDSE